ncbi:hypothetical protein WPS_14940 [Vulcanimicrobium alpinum]|uniref:Peptidase M13 N-terminal domain-containing protein n=2 Tax=Vulcanimicrobium alpinum TaxID=3016050 RepID=A0AAN1XXK6_UNVUL|nr:hypothetical protein WPS_14940 [Vulcanimicrobium alpinum]
MDQAGIEAAGLTPIQPLLDRIAAIRNVPDLVATTAALQQAAVGTNLTLSSRADLLDSNKQIASLVVGGLLLGDRKYYLNDDGKYPYYRGEYLKYAAAQFANLGDADAASEAAAVVALETALAKAIPDRTEFRDPQLTYHPTPLSKLPAVAPDIPWNANFSSFRATGFDTVNVTLPNVTAA